MTTREITPDAYIASLPADRRKTMGDLRAVVKKNLPKGFEETINYGMLGYVVPLKTYPEGYHCDPKLPVPFLNIASQKGGISFYHMGLYAMPDVLKWFKAEYAKAGVGKLDMGKSCVRFKKPEQIPLKLLGELAKKVTVKAWLEVYQKNIRR